MKTFHAKNTCKSLFLNLRVLFLCEQEKSFKESKQSLLLSQLLIHFDPTLKIRLAYDASAYGIGAVLFHEMPDGLEKPIGFVSRTLSDVCPLPFYTVLEQLVQWC